jgi:hypothetical protein
LLQQQLNLQVNPTALFQPAPADHSAALELQLLTSCRCWPAIGKHHLPRDGTLQGRVPDPQNALPALPAATAAPSVHCQLKLLMEDAAVHVLLLTADAAADLHRLAELLGGCLSSVIRPMAAQLSIHALWLETAMSLPESPLS